MTLEEAKEYAKKGIKVTHRYFSDTEYLTMKNNIIEFECGTKVFSFDWIEGKDYLQNGWSFYNDKK